MPIVRMSNHEGLFDPSAKGIPLELVHPCCDLNGTGHERAGPLRQHHLKVIVDHSEGGAQNTELVALRLKTPPRLSEVHGQFRSKPYDATMSELKDEGRSRSHRACQNLMAGKQAAMTRLRVSRDKFGFG